jgi:hypothetical protein
MTEAPIPPFWPQEIGPYEDELQRLVNVLALSHSSQAACNSILSHLADLPEYLQASLQRLRYQAYLLVLHDLLRQGWRHYCRQGRLYLDVPSWEDQENTTHAVLTQKELVREMLNHERLAQLAKPSVQEFIRYMERPRLFKGRSISIHSLFADGKKLSRDLETAIQRENDDDLITVIQPYLQLATQDVRCEHTGLRLIDIWRYMRHTWSLPYYATPGRNMFYLIRDAAQDFHPVIGIAALGNSMMQLSVRDEVIGWTTKSVLSRIGDDKFSDDDARQLVVMLRSTLNAAIADIATSDIIPSGEVAEPTEATLTKLLAVASEAREERLQLLRERENHNGAVKVEVSTMQLHFPDMAPTTSSPSIEIRIEQALFRYKRAESLRELLAAKIALARLAHGPRTAKRLRSFSETEDGRQAIQVVVRENKKRRVGINMMDLIVCGGIPPYNHLLGGKLTAMLMISPQVVYDYAQKYRDVASTIASQMRQAPVIREPKLVFIGTTSLYHSGSSQYNRISIPAIGTSNSRITYNEYGHTLGYGSVHFSAETIKLLNQLQEQVAGATLINNRFGEGINPKFRRISAGLSTIGLVNTDRYVNHGAKRIVYGVPLGRKSCEFLRGEVEDPEYIFDPSSEESRKASTDHIARTWTNRWLKMRIQQKVVLASVENFDVSHILLSFTSGISTESSSNYTMSMTLEETDARTAIV